MIKIMSNYNYIVTSNYLANEILTASNDIPHLNELDRTERLIKIQSDIKLLRYILYSVEHTENLSDELNNDLEDIYKDATNALNNEDKDKDELNRYILKIYLGKARNITIKIGSSLMNEVPVIKEQFIQYVRDIYNITIQDYYVNKDIQFILIDVIRDSVRASLADDLSPDEKQILSNIFYKAYNVMDKCMDDIIKSLLNINDLSQDILNEYLVEEPTLKHYITLINDRSRSLNNPNNDWRFTTKILSGYISNAKLLLYVELDRNLYDELDNKMIAFEHLVDETYHLTDLKSPYTWEQKNVLLINNRQKILSESKSFLDQLKLIRPIVISQEQACQYLHNIYDLSNNTRIKPNEALKEILKYVYLSNQVFKNENLSSIYIQIFDTLTTLKNFDRQHDILDKIKNISLQYINDPICKKRLITYY